MKRWRLWKLGSASIVEVHREITSLIARNTVGTVLERLRTKQLVTRWRNGTFHIYQALLPREVANKALCGIRTEEVPTTISGMTPAYATEILVETMHSLDPRLIVH
jgi:predicted transcriptional regulator